MLHHHHHHHHHNHLPPLNVFQSWERQRKVNCRLNSPQEHFSHSHKAGDQEGLSKYQYHHHCNNYDFHPHHLSKPFQPLWKSRGSNQELSKYQYHHRHHHCLNPCHRWHLHQEILLKLKNYHDCPRRRCPNLLHRHLDHGSNHSAKVGQLERNSETDKWI